ncbi:hypothetical protein G7Z17_g5484 [Cylindrodendrum hubeiense]|uniref:Uncharacterized protein n=1 Tax=Cylindrodendrum hubeiense TaxID=595255 RepID=A0A9P5HC03_9HYPO|nr:hypothetical protein G7Z17_g5484 [Cylindrodendrum hubeiense]
MTNPSTSCSYHPKPSPSPSSFQPSEHVFDHSTSWQMPLSHRPSGHGAHASSSKQPLVNDEGYDSASIDLIPNTFSQLNEGACGYNSHEFTKMIDAHIPDGQIPSDVGYWIQGSQNSPVPPPAPGVAVPWGSHTGRQPHINKVFDFLGTAFASADPTSAPTSAPASAPASTLASAPALVPARMPFLPPMGNAMLPMIAPPPAVTSGQMKRGWSGRQSPSDSEEEDDQYRGTRHDPYKKKTTAPPPTRRGPNDINNPIYPRRIPQVIRNLEDDDFEHSSELCPFYLHEPYQYTQKPWNSCGKQRAEFSHTLSHAVSDHSLIRGRNPKRKSQRFITKCAHSDPSIKGKSKCEHCNKPGRWTDEDPQDPADESHFGGALCLRCYTQLPTKADLFSHHNELNICIYREDLALKVKMRVLYTVFCSSSEVPKFKAPINTPRPDGARGRKLKRAASQMQNSRGQSQAIRSLHPQPTASQLNSPLPTQINSPLPSTQLSSPLSLAQINSPQISSQSLMLANMDLSENGTQSYYHTYAPQQPESLWSDLGASPLDSDSSTFAAYGTNFNTIPIHCIEISPGFSDPPWSPQLLQNPSGFQVRAQPMGKNANYVHTDSGFGSVLDEDIMNPEYFNDAYGDIPSG